MSHSGKYKFDWLLYTIYRPLLCTLSAALFMRKLFVLFCRDFRPTNLQLVAEPWTTQVIILTRDPELPLVLPFGNVAKLVTPKHIVRHVAQVLPKRRSKVKVHHQEKAFFKSRFVAGLPNSMLKPSKWRTQNVRISIPNSMVEWGFPGICEGSKLLLQDCFHYVPPYDHQPLPKLVGS